MKLLNMTEMIKGKVVSEIFFNDAEWVIKFEDGQSITLGLQEYKRKAVYHLDGQNQIYSIEIDSKPTEVMQ